MMLRGDYVGDVMWVLSECWCGGGIDMLLRHSFAYWDLFAQEFGANAN